MHVCVQMSVSQHGLGCTTLLISPALTNSCTRTCAIVFIDTHTHRTIEKMIHLYLEHKAPHINISRGKGGWAFGRGERERGVSATTFKPQKNGGWRKRITKEEVNSVVLVMMLPKLPPKEEEQSRRLSPSALRNQTGARKLCILSNTQKPSRCGWQGLLGRPIPRVLMNTAASLARTRSTGCSQSGSPETAGISQNCPVSLQWKDPQAQVIPQSQPL